MDDKQKQQALDKLEREMLQLFTPLEPADLAPGRDEMLFRAGRQQAARSLLRFKRACGLLAACLAVCVAGLLMHSGQRDHGDAAPHAALAGGSAGEANAGDDDMVAVGGGGHVAPDADSGDAAATAAAAPCVHVASAAPASEPAAQPEPRSYLDQRDEIIAELAPSQAPRPRRIPTPPAKELTLHRLIYSLENLASLLENSPESANQAAPQCDKHR